MITNFKLFEKNINKIEINLNSDLLPLLNVNMYNSTLDSDEVLSNDLEELTEEAKDLYFDLYDNKKYVEFILNESNKFMQNIWKPILTNLKIIGNINFGIYDIEATSIYSPKQYNYGGDELNYKISVDENFDKLLKTKLDIIVKNEKTKFEKYLEQYKSIDGFWSYMPDNIKDLTEFLNKDNPDYDRGISIMLKYMLGDKIKEKQQEFVIQVYESEHNYLDFLDKNNEKYKEFLDLI